MSTLSKTDLVNTLLSPSGSCGPTGPLRVNDHEPTYGLQLAEQVLLTHRLGAARELILRDLRSKMRAGPLMKSPQILRDWLRLHCAALEHEVFIAIYLDARHALIDTEQLFRGTLTQTSVYPRELVKSALARNAAAVAVAHNHPSGSAEPSRADEYLTQSLKAALNVVDVRLLDHLVVAGDNVVSLAERGLV